MTALTLPAHSLLTGDRVCIGGHWHLVGRVTVENQEPEGATVHVVLDHGTDQADLDADATFEVQRAVTLTQTPNGLRVNQDRTALQGMTPNQARLHALALLNAAADAEAADGTEPDLDQLITHLLGGAS